MASKFSRYNFRNTREIGKISQGSMSWSLEEKKRLLEGLKKYGDQDLKALHSVVESKLAFQIEQYIRLMKKKSRKKNKREASLTNQPLKRWFDIMKARSTTNTICEPRPQAMLALLQARRGDLPEYNSENCPVHLEQAYEYLYSLFSGRRYQINARGQISRQNKLFVYATIAELRKQIMKNKAVLFRALLKSFGSAHYEPNPENYRSVSVLSSSLNPLQLVTEPISTSDLR